MSLSNYPEELKQARQEVIWKISGAGFGCTLIRRQVLERIEFRESGDHNASPDLGFAEDVLRAGFEQYGRFDVPVWHWADDRWLNPFQERRRMRYLAVETTRAIAAGRYITLMKDVEIELNEQEARELMSIGLVRRLMVDIPAKPEPGIVAPELEPPIAAIESPAIAAPIVETEPAPVVTPKAARGKKNRAK
jgi:hypothetical protein